MAAQEAQQKYRFDDAKLQQYWQAWKKEPTSANLKELMQQAQPIIDYAIHYYASDLAAVPSLRLQAKALVLDSMHKFDPSKGSLVNYLLLNLQRLQRYAGQERRMLHQSERMAMQLQAIEKATQELLASLGRPPTTQELADYLGLSTEQIRLMRQQSKLPVPAAAMPSEDVVPQTLSSRNAELEELLKYCYDESDAIDKYIIESKFGLFGSPIRQNTEIAKQFNISPAAITKRLDNINKRLMQLAELLR